MMNHAEKLRLEMIIDELAQANSAVDGITMVLDALLEAEGDAECNFFLCGNDFVKGCMFDGISTICLLVDRRLNDLRALGGIELEG